MFLEENVGLLTCVQPLAQVVLKEKEPAFQFGEEGGTTRRVLLGSVFQITL